VKRDRPVLIGLLVAVFAVYGLRRADLFGNGAYLVSTLVALAAAPAIAGRRAKAGAGAAAADSSGEAAGEEGPHSDVGEGVVHAALSFGGHADATRGLHAPPELLGLTEPFTDADVAALDEAVDLTAVAGRVEEGAGSARG
jgi:hypothetical protein